MQTDYAYVAGFFDGEGNIDLARSGKGCFNVRITITQANLEILEWMRSLFGCGKIQRKCRTGNRRPTWDLRFNGQDAYRVLGILIPHLRLKRNEAMVAIRMCYRQQGRVCGHHLSQAEKEIREKIMEDFATSRGDKSLTVI